MESPTTSPMRSLPVYHRLPWGSQAAASVGSRFDVINSSAPPSIGTRTGWPLTPWLPTTQRPSGDTSGLPNAVAPWIGVPVSASSACRTNWGIPSAFTTA